MISITFDYPADIAEVQKLLAGGTPGQAKAVTPKPPASVTPIKPAAGANKPAAAPKAPAEGALDYERDVKPTALTLSRNPTLRPELVKIYKKFNVAVGSELKPEQLADALAQMKAVLGQ